MLSTSCVVALLAGLLTGLLPALRFTRFGPTPLTQHTIGGNTRRMGGLFTITQIAFSLILLTLSAALLQELYRLLHTPLGFDTENLQTCSVDVGWNLKEEDRHRLYQQTEAAIAALPGVSAVGAISALPLSTSAFAVPTILPVLPSHNITTAWWRKGGPSVPGTSARCTSRCWPAVRLRIATALLMRRRSPSSIKRLLHGTSRGERRRTATCDCRRGEAGCSRHNRDHWRHRRRPRAPAARSRSCLGPKSTDRRMAPGRILNLQSAPRSRSPHWSQQSAGLCWG